MKLCTRVNPDKDFGRGIFLNLEMMTLKKNFFLTEDNRFPFYRGGRIVSEFSLRGSTPDYARRLMLKVTRVCHEVTPKQISRNIIMYLHCVPCFIIYKDWRNLPQNRLQ